MRPLWITTSLSAALLVTHVAGAQPVAPEPPPPLDPWYEALDFRLFVDAYATVNTAFPKPQSDANTLRDGPGSLRAYDRDAGFSLSWVGADVSYAPAPVGGTLNLRLGPTAEIYSHSCLSALAGRCDGDAPGLGMVKQAYASWRPGGEDGTLTFDFGKFNSTYGAEVAESQDNLNYTRGAVYWLAQPLFFTGLRAHWEIAPEIGLLAVAANGWNDTVDNNLGKTFGLQAALRPWASFHVTLGWLGGPEQDDTASITCPADTTYSTATGGCVASPGEPAGRHDVDQGGANQPEAWRHLLDLVLDYTPTESLRLVLNADYGWQGTRVRDTDAPTVHTDRQQYYGAALSARYALSESFAVAARGEYFEDPDGLGSSVSGLRLATGTLTLEAMPNDFLVLRLEGRGDFALDADHDRKIFKDGVRESASRLVTTTLGVVVTTN
jgi:hypothetical protein